MLTSCLVEDVERILSADIPWTRFSGKRVLVTGAGGFIATYIVETLLALKHGPKEVIGLVRNLPKARLRFAHHADRGDFRLIGGDVSNPLSLDTELNFFIHAASQASPKFYLTDPMGTLAPNAIGTYHLLERARADKAEGFLFVSSGEVYGQINSEVPVDETHYGYLDPTAVRSCYAESKRMGETLCVSAYDQHGVATDIARLFHTYGPGLAVDDGRVFSDFIADIAARRAITIKSDGSARRPFCYVSDAVAGLFTVMLKGEPARPYNVSNDKAYVSIRELADTLALAFPDRSLKIAFDPSRTEASYAPSPVAGYCPSVEALRNLGWEASVTITEGFQRSVLAIEQEDLNR